MPTILEPLSVPQLSFLAILLVAFGLPVTEWLRHDIVAVLIIVALATIRLLKASEALAGFSSEAAIVARPSSCSAPACTIQASPRPSAAGLASCGRQLHPRGAVIMPSVALLSVFTHHLTTTALMLPVTLNLARERGNPPPKLLMPLPFAASLGTTISLPTSGGFTATSRLPRVR